MSWRPGGSTRLDADVPGELGASEGQDAGRELGISRAAPLSAATLVGGPDG
ncbi:MAG: hypothetical protein KF850_30525 [Labilithrix sp.]|nr:hypothetical protein [Labilithrix sp.]